MATKDVYQLQKPRGPTNAEINERKELNKKKTKKEGNGKMLNEVDAARLAELKSINKQYKKDMEEYEAHLQEAEKRHRYIQATSIQSVCRRFLTQARMVRLKREQAISDLENVVDRLLSLGFQQTSISALVSVKVAASEQVMLLQSKGKQRFNKPLSTGHGLTLEQQAKRLGLPSPEANPQLYWKSKELCGQAEQVLGIHRAPLPPTEAQCAASQHSQDLVDRRVQEASRKANKNMK